MVCSPPYSYLDFLLYLSLLAKQTQAVEPHVKGEAEAEASKEVPESVSKEAVVSVLGVKVYASPSPLPPPRRTSPGVCLTDLTARCILSG